MQYTDKQGNPVTSLPIDEYALYLANEICDIKADITNINNAVTDIYNRLTILENCVLPCSPSQGGGDPQVISSCIISGGQLVPASTLLLALETAYCNFQQAVGSVSDIQLAINATCIYGTSGMLSQTGNFGDLTNWAATPSTLADINRNQWLAICDIYNAVLDIQQNCCVTDCTTITWGVVYSVNTDITTGLPTSLNFNFTSTTVPASYTDCGTSQIVLTDANGSSITQAINVVNLANDPAGVNINLQTSGLIITQSLSAAVTMCATDGTNTCQETQNLTVALGIPCPQNAILTPTANSIAVQFSNNLGTGYTYQIDCIDVATTAVAGTTTISSPGTSVSHTFTGLAQGTNYQIVTTITDNTTAQSTQCILGTVSTTGQSCTTDDTTNVVSGTGQLTDLYLGHKNDGDLHQRYYLRYNGPSLDIIQEPGVAQECRNPLLTFSSATPTGDITIDLEYNTTGSGVGTSMTYQYSNDMINWVGTNTVSTDQIGLVLNTGFTTGSVYIRAFTTCTSINTTYTLLRYDFNTGDARLLTDEANCVANFSFAGACPSGVYVATTTLECDGTTHTIPGGLSDRNNWYYVGKVEVGGIVKYAYAGWNTNGDCTKVVLCCDCPAYIFGAPKAIVVGAGQSVDFTLSYLIGDGTPSFNVITNPNYGTVTQDPNDNNMFTYTQSGLAAPADTFEVELVPLVAGECMSTTFIVQIQIIAGTFVGVKSSDSNAFMFIDTNSFQTSDAPRLGTIATNLKADIQSECPSWTGELYVVPTTDSRWLGYSKGIVDKGASIALNTLPDWDAITVLPTDWTGGATVPNSNGYVIVMSNATSPDYHDNTLAAGWGAFPNNQPKPAYLNDYEAYLDIINGTEVSAWAQAQGFGGTPPFPDGVSVLYYPITVDTSGLTASAILQGLGSYYATMIPPTEYGVQTAVDVTGYLMQGLVPSATNPYQGTFTPGGVAIEGLWTKGVFMWLDQSTNGAPLVDYLQEIASQTDGDEFKDKMLIGIKGTNETCPTAPATQYLIAEDCVNPGNTINFANTGGVATIGTVVELSGKCYTVVDLASDGVTVPIIVHPDCPTCTSVP